MMNLQNRSFRWLLAELLIIVLGIMIAFQFEDLRAKRDERREEKIALLGIVRDLNAELEYIERVRATYQRQYDAAQRLAANLTKIENFTESEIAANYIDATFGTFWSSTAPTYQELRANGNLYLISNSELLREFSNYNESRTEFVRTFTETVTVARDNTVNAATSDIFTSPTAVLGELEEYSATEAHRLNNGATLYVLFTNPIEEIPRNPDFFPTLSRLNSRLGSGIGHFNNIELDTLLLIERVEEHLSNI